ncbi:MAG: prolyl oligopeptidase family serine peptidase [Planctomycetota bacterium]
MTDAYDRGTRRARRWLALLVALVVASCALAARVQTDGGRVRVRGVTIPTQNGQWVAGDLFRPRTATAETPAPLVVVVPGFQRSKEALSNIAIELARRGVVALSIDPYGQGWSSSSMSRRAATTEGYGAFAIVDYAYATPNLNYVDRERIAVTGHSAGGNAAIRAADHFGRAAAPDEPSRLHSAYVSGYVLTLRDKILAGVRSNVGASYALFDEGAYRNELGNGDMRTAPEALRLIRSGRPEGAPRIEEVEIGRLYGSAAERTLRVMHNEPVLHPFQPYDVEATANQIAFFETVFGLDSGLDPRDQTWMWKELWTLVALVASLLAVLPLARVLLATAAFRPLVRPVPVPAPAPRGRQRPLFWALLGVGALVACVSYIPMAELSKDLFVDASTRRQTWFFPQRMNNAVLLWALLNGAFGFVLFFGGHLAGQRLARADAGPRERVAWGAAIGPADLLRTCLLAALLYGLYVLLLFGVDYVFHVDYRFLFMGTRAFQPELFLLLGMYAPGFFVFFLSNSLRANAGLRFAGWPEWATTLLAAAANSFGLLLIVAVQYATFVRTGTVFWTDGWLYVNLLFAVVPMMFVLPIFHRAFFLMTGRIYLGPLTVCAIFITVLLSNTVCYLPL